MTCPNNKSGKHCYEEDPEAHRGGIECCLCGQRKVASTLRVDPAKKELANKLIANAKAKVEAVHEAATARQTPIIHCAICHQKAPRVLVNDHPQPGNLLRLDDKVWQNNLDGWMLATFPFRDEYIKDRRESVNNHRFGVTFEEVAKLCPPCATKVREYMAHLAKPMLSSEDL